MSIRKEDVLDVDFRDAVELASDGYFVYLTTSIVTTTSGTNTIVVTLPADGEGLKSSFDHPVNHNDRIRLVGTSGGVADGYYTVNLVLNDTSFTTNQPIVSSTGGTIYFMHPSGSSGIGIDSSNLSNTGANNLQDAIQDIDVSISNIYNTTITPTQHQTLRQLIHFLDEGPGDGFASGAYKETLTHPFPTSIIWYTDITKSKIIVSKTIIRNSIQIPTTITWEVYMEDGITVAHTVVDTITYINNVFESSRTRNIT